MVKRWTYLNKASPFFVFFYLNGLSNEARVDDATVIVGAQNVELQSVELYLANRKDAFRSLLTKNKKIKIKKVKKVLTK